MQNEQIQALLAPFVAGDPLTTATVEQVSRYLDLLLKWNAKMNLTAVRRADDMVTRHFGESFFAAKEWLSADDVKNVIDLGSGAGFPGLPMAIYAPQTRVTLIESQNKKATFMKEVVRELALANVNVFAGRGEDYPGRASLVTMRAVEKFGEAVRTASVLVEPGGGKLGVMIGADQHRDLPAEFEWKVGKTIPGTTGRIVVLGSRK